MGLYFVAYRVIRGGDEIGCGNCILKSPKPSSVDEAIELRNVATTKAEDSVKSDFGPDSKAVIVSINKLD